VQLLEQELLTLPKHLSSPPVEEIEDTNGKSESVNRRMADNTMAKRERTKRQTMIYKTYAYN
jgi:hypothetical protein